MRMPTLVIPLSPPIVRAHLFWRTRLSMWPGLFFSIPPRIFVVSPIIELTGARHANKSVGPSNWLAAHCKDGAGASAFYTPRARAIDLPVTIHQGAAEGYLERGVKGVVEYFKEQLDRAWLRDDELLLVAYDRKELVPLIKDREQAGRTRAAGETTVSFDHESTTAILKSEFQSWLRRDGKAARDGIADALAQAFLDDARWNGPNRPKGDAAFYGVGVGVEPGLTFGGGAMDAGGNTEEGTGA